MNARKRWGLAATLTLVAGGLLGMAAPTAANAAVAPRACTLKPHEGHLAGLVPAVGNCPVSSLSDVAQGTPPLLFHGGNVMMTPSSSPLIVTPIFWEPVGHPIAPTYTQLITQYVLDVSAASATGLNNTNVYSVANEYFGANGQIHYNVRIGIPIVDTGPLPPSGCIVASNDHSGIYGDGTGYDACLDDAQVQGEINRLTVTRLLAHDLSHIYVLYLPKHVESCFNPGSTLTASNACTINHQPSAAFCAYHGQATSNAVYANMPYPIYNSAVGFTCGTEFNFGSVQSPNHNPDGDVVLNPTSHEINEAITDPDTATGWFDSSGFENGDECNFTFGAVGGAPGQFFNQVINGQRFLTQEEFSNHDFAITGGGCVQGANQEA